MGRLGTQASMAGRLAARTSSMEATHARPPACRSAREAVCDASGKRYAQRCLFRHGRTARRRSSSGQRSSRHRLPACRQARSMVARMGRDRAVEAFNRGQPIRLHPPVSIQRRRLYPRPRRARKHPPGEQPFARRHRRVRALAPVVE
jgi:hypothetical protein